MKGEIDLITKTGLRKRDLLHLGMVTMAMMQGEEWRQEKMIESKLGLAEQITALASSLGIKEKGRNYLRQARLVWIAMTMRRVNVGQLRSGVIV